MEKLKYLKKSENLMQVGIIGTGYVGLITGVGFALKGNDVLCLDTDLTKVNKINQKIPPIFEAGLTESLEKLVPTKLTATSIIPNLFASLK